MAERSTAAPTALEIMATVLSHDLADGEIVNIGANMAVARAGSLLAHLTHGPNMIVTIAMTKANLIHEPRIEEFELLTDHRATRWAEAYYRHDEHLANVKFRRRSVFFAGALQVDPFGNSNLIGIGDDYKALRMRGPGTIGTCNGTAMYGRFHLVLSDHSRRIFVPRCDYVSAVGWGRDGQTRKTLGLPGSGPRYCITPLCVMDFEDETKRMRLRSVHPGVTTEEVVTRTGFELVIPEQVPETPQPSALELQLLRTRIDVAGRLRV